MMAAATGSLACARGRVHTRACTPSCHVMLAAIWATIAGTRLTIGPLGGACQAASHSAATRCALSLTAILFLSRVALPCCRSSSHWSGRHAANLCISVPPIAVPHHRSPHHHCRIIAVPPSQSPLPPRPSCPPPPPPSPPAPLPASPPLSPTARAPALASALALASTDEKRDRHQQNTPYARFHERNLSHGSRLGCNRFARVRAWPRAHACLHTINFPV